MMKVVAGSILFLCVLFLAPCGINAGDLFIKDPWIREAPPHARMLAAYLSIVNTSAHVVRLTSASSPDFKMVELHQSKTKDGMAYMAKQAAIVIDKGETVQLEPGGYHLMLMNPKRILSAGDEVGLKLNFDNGEVLAVRAVVRKQ